MKALVTGATGFVGRALVADLAKRGWDVRAAVRRSGAVVPSATETCEVADLSSTTDWSAALDGVDVVLHLAARVHVMRDSADGVREFQRVNVEGTRRLAEQAAAAGVRRMVFLSSVKVNGENTAPARPFTERDGAAPLDPYGISKADAEAAVRAVSSASSLEAVIIRPPLVYGPGVKANFQSMVGWIKRGRPLPFGSVRDNRRSFVALGNLVDLIATCATHPAARDETFLVSDGDDLSTAELMRRIALAAGVASRLLPIPLWFLRALTTVTGKSALYQRLCGNLQVDSTKARSLLSWTPPLSVDEGLRRAVHGGGGPA